MNALIGAVLGVMGVAVVMTLISLLFAILDWIGERFGANAAGFFGMALVFAIIGAAVGRVIGAQ